MVLAVLRRQNVKDLLRYIYIDREKRFIVCFFRASITLLYIVIIDFTNWMHYHDLIFDVNYLMRFL